MFNEEDQVWNKVLNPVCGKVKNKVRESINV